MRLAIAAALMLLAAAAGLIACGGDDDAADSAEATSTSAATGPATSAESGPDPLRRDPCRLLDAAAVRRVFGEPVEGRAEEGHDANVCGYRGGRERRGKTPVPSGLDVFVGIADFVEQSRRLAEQGADPVEPIAGVGDSAFVSGNDAGAIVGEAGILLSVQGVDPSDPALHELLAELLENAAAAY
jgi:hypothetical protein